MLPTYNWEFILGRCIFLSLKNMQICVVFRSCMFVCLGIRYRKLLEHNKVIARISKFVYKTLSLGHPGTIPPLKNIPDIHHNV